MTDSYSLLAVAGFAEAMSFFAVLIFVALMAVLALLIAIGCWRKVQKLCFAAFMMLALLGFILQPWQAFMPPPEEEVEPGYEYLQYDPDEEKWRRVHQTLVFG